MKMERNATYCNLWVLGGLTTVHRYIIDADNCFEIKLAGLPDFAVQRKWRRHGAPSNVRNGAPC